MIALGETAAVLCLAFAALFLVCRRVANYGFVDVGWSYAFAPCALFLAAGGHGWAPRRWFDAALVALWSVRLGTHLWIRVRRHHPREDARYADYRRRWTPWVFFAFFEGQALSVALLLLPLALAVADPTPGWRVWEAAGAVLWAVAIAGEALADRQMSRFKADPANRGAVCRAGLWKYSRHPNYFFESLVWWAYFLLAVGAPGGGFAVVCPLLMLFLLLRVTGIPPTEALAVRSKGDAYRDYQRTTSAFFPWFPRK